MPIEPLQGILKIYGDKHKVLLHYLPDRTTSRLRDHIYKPEMFLYDRSIAVKKSTGLIEAQGMVIKSNDKRFKLKTNKGNISLNTSDYYVFIKPRKNKLRNNRRFYMELLKSLE